MLALLAMLLLAQPALAGGLGPVADLIQGVAQQTEEPGLFDKILDLFLAAPYIWIPVLMIAAGLGFPLPEEIILVFTGYLAYANPETHHIGLLFAACVASILLGDLIPFLLGRIFGPKILKIRLVRTWMHTERLARLNAFFEKHGRLTILLARFITGVRTPAFFSAGTMRMGILRFLIMDGIGAVIGSALFIWIGHISGAKIDIVIDWIHRTERGLLILVIAASVGLVFYLWWRHHRRQRLLGEEVRETFVRPSQDRAEGEEGPERREVPILSLRRDEPGQPEPADRVGPEIEGEDEGWVLPTERKNGEGS